MELRSRMVPYIYTNARVAYDTGIAISHPLYYEFPTFDESYTEQNQYLFGHNIMVVPITQPVDNITQLAMRKLWIPPGVWIEWSSLKIYGGPQYILKSYALSETPVFVKAGSVIPMLPVNRPLLGSTNNQYSTLQLNAFCSNQGIALTSLLYEDAGNDQNFTTQSMGTQIRFSDSISSANLTVFPATFTAPYPGMLKSRSYILQFNGLLPPSQIMVNNQTVPFAQNANDYGWTYDSTYFSVIVNLPQQFLLADGLQVEIKKSTNFEVAQLIPGVARCFSRLTYVMNFLDNHFPLIYQEDYPNVSNANEIAQSPVSNIESALQNFNSLLQSGIQEIKILSRLSPTDKQQAVAFLSDCMT